MQLLILCVVPRNYHDISTVHARAREVIISDTEEHVIISPASAGLVATTRAGQHGAFVQPKEAPPQDAPGWDAQGCIPLRGLGKWGLFYAAHHGHFPSFTRDNQLSSGLCRVIPHETEPTIRSGFLTEATHLQALPKPCKSNFCRKPIKVGRGRKKRKKDCIPLEPKTMPSLNVIKSIIK